MPNDSSNYQLMIKPLFLVAGLGVVLSLLGGYNAIHVPLQRQAQLSRQTAAEEQAIQQMQAEVAALLAQVERYRARLPEAPDPSTLARDVVTLAEQSGIQLTSIARDAPEPLRSSPGFTLLTVTLTGTASYHQLGVFLDALERSERLLRVNQFELSRQGDQGPVALRMSVSTLYLQPLLPAAAGSGA